MGPQLGDQAGQEDPVFVWVRIGGRIVAPDSAADNSPRLRSKIAMLSSGWRGGEGDKNDPQSVLMGRTVREK